MNNEQLLTNCEVGRVVDNDAVITPSIAETNYLLQSPVNAEHLARSIEQYEVGKIVENTLLSHPTATKLSQI